MSILLTAGTVAWAGNNTPGVPSDQNDQQEEVNAELDTEQDGAAVNEDENEGFSLFGIPLPWDYFFPIVEEEKTPLMKRAPHTFRKY